MKIEVRVGKIRHGDRDENGKEKNMKIEVSED